ncbi:thiamine phosphate synthase [Methanocella arvoryzae]|uniref:Thiamine-phosphate synthase n=1 Tax=Methanocella arvoryzae (strain DSM 22066 / NBRC 105507 / MRE50) TaxID=351160 RepID=THIE_METAR|nr:thiamine phosphate synthase [Methanocella arvoryzae]Q0W1L8.1 RecName: Full=Thiamine-phosphate synthase; Short=TP synthase; Short=TPS; AltName: Full=Thiamine-phosphate pyrophosphorylase; Short=TMP pyrophosphorylase; Short=TMP-PPase [Methanocella arvoryzae MRE50]CAJ37725.1 thiamine-phosphate pyrophosphorylase [Methanocella arvoryzae MRE50]
MQYDLYVVTDEGLSRGLTHPELARRAIAGSADVIQLRDKKCDCDYLLRCAMEMREDCNKAGVTFIVNDRLDVALQSQADGVHIGQSDMPLKFARRVAPKGFIIGVSAGTVEEALRAEHDGADYIGFGPVFPTGSKADAGPVCGLDLLREVRRRVSIPVVAIGGINAANAPEVLAAGADGLAVISAVVSQEDVTAAARNLKAIISQYRLSGRQ